MSRLDAIVLAIGSLGLAANLALSQPNAADSVRVAPTGMTPTAVDKDAARSRTRHDRVNDSKPAKHPER